MNSKEFLVTGDVKEITRAHSLERIKYEFDRFGLDKEKRIQMIELGTLGQLIFKQYLDQEGLIYDFEFQAGNYDDKDFQVGESIVEIKTSGYSEKDGYSNLNAIYNHNQMQHAERKNISLVVQVFVNGYSKSAKTFNLEKCDRAVIVGFSTIKELKDSKLRYLPFGKAYLKPLKELHSIEDLKNFI